MYFLTVKLKDFSAAHRLVKDYQGKCNHLHGHNYSLQVVIAAQGLAANGLVIDFSDVRSFCNEWVQTNLDHSTLVYSGDDTLLTFVKEHQQKHFIFDNNTSAEILATQIYQNLSHIFKEVSLQRQQEITLHQVELWESSECGVIYTDNQTMVKGVTCGQ